MNYTEYYYDYDEEFYWEEDEDSPCKDNYYYGKTVGTNVLASDLGVIVKKGQTNSFTTL